MGICPLHMCSERLPRYIPVLPLLHVIVRFPKFVIFILYHAKLT